MSSVQPISERRLAANRSNAQLSTGPKTPEGRAVSSLNAVKTGLTGRAVLLPSEDAEAYETHLLRYVEMFAPQGERETELVQSLADTQWRLNRIPNLEAGFYALGRRRYVELFSPTETHLLDAYILQEDAKHFKNLHLQESRLTRYYERDLKELKALQAERKKSEEEEKEKEAAAKPKTLAASVGFEFSTPKEEPKPNGAARTATGFNGPLLETV